MGAAGSTVMSEMKDKVIAKHFLDPDIVNLLGNAFIQRLPDPVPVDQLMNALKDRTDVFLTHNWGPNQDNHRRVAAINEGLKAKGLLTWFDSEKMEGNVKKKMIQGIDNAQCVVVCITQLYIDKVAGDNAEDNCQLEFGYASRKKTAKRMVPVVMESGVRNPSAWEGEVSMVLGGVLYVDMCDDLSAEKVKELHDRIVSVNNGVKLSDVFDRCVKLVMAHGTVSSGSGGAVAAAAVSQPGSSSGTLKLQDWLVETVHLTVKAAETCNKILADANIGSVERLMRRYEKNKNLLSELGIDEYDAEDILRGLNVADDVEASSKTYEKKAPQNDLSKQPLSHAPLPHDDSIVRTQPTVTKSVTGAGHSGNMTVAHTLLAENTGHSGSVVSMLLHSGRLYSGSEDRTVKVWDLSSHACVATLTGHGGSVLAMACDMNFLYCTDDNMIKVWNLSNHAFVATMNHHTMAVMSLAHSGGRLYSGSGDKSIIVWNVSNRNLVAILTGHSDNVRSLLCVRNRLYSASDDKSIKVWDLSNFKCLATLTGHTGGVTSLLIVGGHLCSGSLDKTIKLWDVSSNACESTIKSQHGSVKSLTSDGKRLFSCVKDYICIWDLSSLKSIGMIGHQGSMTVAVSGAQLYSGSGDSSVMVVDWANCGNRSTFSGQTTYISALVPSGDRLLSGSYNNAIKVWDLSNHTCVATLTGHSDRIFTLLLVGGRLYSGSADGLIKVWDLTSNKCVASMSSKHYGIAALACANGTLCSGTCNHAIDLWDMSRNTFITTLTGHESWAKSLAFVGGRLFSGSGDSTIKLWDLFKYTSTSTLTGHSGEVTSLLGIDGRLYSGSTDCSIRVWDVSSLTCLFTLTEHSSVLALAFDNGLLYSGCRDKTIKVWDLSAHKCVSTLTGHTGCVVSVALEGGKLFSGSEDMSIKIWH